MLQLLHLGIQGLYLRLPASWPSSVALTIDQAPTLAEKGTLLWTSLCSVCRHLPFGDICNVRASPDLLIKTARSELVSSGLRRLVLGCQLALLDQKAPPHTGQIAPAPLLLLLFSMGLSLFEQLEVCWSFRRRCARERSRRRVHLAGRGRAWRRREVKRWCGGLVELLDDLAECPDPPFSICLRLAPAVHNRLSGVFPIAQQHVRL